MKRYFTLLATLMLALNTFGQVGINTETPDASAALDITSTIGGLLVPRMTAAQRDSISVPTQGLIIFCTNCAVGEGELQIRLTSNWKNLLGGNVNDPAFVGDFHQGGVVFYIYQSGDTGYVSGETHGLVAAVEDQSSGIQWFNGSYVTTGATPQAVGTGSANTDAIIAAQGQTVTDYAAGLARAYDGGGYTDWFLPSMDELNEMYENKATIDATAASNGGSSFINTLYWSSSQASVAGAWCQHFANGSDSFKIQDDTYGVRAVRAF